MDTANTTRFMLLNRQFALCELSYDHERHRISHIEEVFDGDQRMPVGFHAASDKSLFLDRWWGNRSIPNSRDNLFQILQELAIPTSRELAMLNHGLSLSDQYWIKSLDDATTWEEINYFNNHFSEDLGRILMGQKAFLGDEDLGSPDNTSDGVLPKRWVIRDGARFLLKGSGVNGQEPFNECVASEMHRRLLSRSDYIPYELCEVDGKPYLDGKPYSLCENMLTDKEEYIPMQYVRELREQGQMDDLSHVLLCCESLGIRDAEKRLSELVVCDYLIANSDRHYRNFGVIRNVETLECRMAPIFDSGTSLWCDCQLLTFDNLSYRSRPFSRIPEQQLAMVRDYSWFESRNMDGFIDSAIEHLGVLYKNNQPRLLVIEKALRDNMATVERFASGDKHHPVLEYLPDK